MQCVRFAVYYPLAVFPPCHATRPAATGQALNQTHFYMQKKLSYMAVAIVSIVLLATACAKTGPTGPQGAIGVAGPQGPTGPQGPQGNANVFTDTLSLASADWLWNSGYTYSNSNGGTVTYFTRYHDVVFSKITQGMLDSG